MLHEEQQILYMQVRLARMASERWCKPLCDITEIFASYGVLGYIHETFGILHVQGDEANINDIEQYLKKKGAEI